MNESEPVQKYYDSILGKNIESIKNFIDDKTSESYYLEFKQTEKKDYKKQRKLYESDKKNLAKAISAFGNSEGGILIWGIKTGSSDSDYADEVNPVEGVSNFKSLLESFSTLMVTPPHITVEHKIIYENEKENTGYVVSYIPKSLYRPHQVIHSSSSDSFKYFIRAGSSSLPAPDTFLRSLFGKQPQPNVFITWGVNTGINYKGEKTLNVLMLLHNRGESVAKNLNGYLNIGGENITIEIKDTVHFNLYKNTINGTKIGFSAKDGFVLGVEQEVAPIYFEIPIIDTYKKGIQIIALVSADNQPLCKIEIFKNHPDVSKAIQLEKAGNAGAFQEMLLGKAKLK